MQVVGAEVGAGDRPVGGLAPAPAVVEQAVGGAPAAAAAHAEITDAGALGLGLRRWGVDRRPQPAVEPVGLEGEVVLGDVAVEGGIGAERDVAGGGPAALA